MEADEDESDADGTKDTLWAFAKIKENDKRTNKRKEAHMTINSFENYMESMYKDEDMIGKQDTIKQLVENLVDDKIISQEYLNEGSLSTLVGGVSAALAIKVKSKFRKMKSATDWQQKLNYMGEMIVLNVYGSVMSAAVAGRNTSILNKIKSIGKK